MNDYALLALGVAFAAAGGEFFIRGSVGIATWLRIPPGIVGATIAAFATSSPELSVAATAAVSGEPQIALGNALGSNVVNVAWILGLCLTIFPVRAEPGAMRRDFPVAAAAPALTALLLLDGTVSRLDAGILAAVFAAWTFRTASAARRERNAAGEVLGEPRALRAAGYSAAGLALLMAAGKFIVSGARGVAESRGMDEFAVGATVVALGTTVPELATALSAKFRGHDEVGLGAVLGSNIFNGLFIVPVAAFIHPIDAELSGAGLALGTGVAAVILSIPPRSGELGRWRGAALLALLAAYFGLALSRG